MKRRSDATSGSERNEIFIVLHFTRCGHIYIIFRLWTPTPHPLLSFIDLITRKSNQLVS